MSENKKKSVFKNLKISIGKSGLILLAVFAVLLAADLVLKYCAQRYEWQFTVIPKVIEVVRVQYNTGAAFSFLDDKAWAQAFFITITFIMLAVMTAAFLLLPKRFVTLKTAVVMIAAGATGNLVDRLAFGCVRDFVNVWMFGSFACCNFADFWITFGVAVAVIDMLFLNEWAAFPLTKKAKAAQREKKLAEEAGAECADTPAETAERSAEPDVEPSAQTDVADGGNVSGQTGNDGKEQ